MKQKKKLPRYWLGTRKPTGLGYQPNRGIGDTTFNTQKGIPVQDAADTLHKNQFYTGFNKFIAAAQNPMHMVQNMKTVPVITQIGAQAANQAAANFGTSTLQAGGSNIGSLSNTIGNINKLGLENKLAGGSVQTGTKTAMSPMGIATGALGTIYGTGALISDISHAGDTISQSQIRDSAATNTVTTAGGNTYTERGGIDSKGIMDYEHEMAKSKKIGLTADTMGLGASVGGLAASLGLMGSVGGPLGTAIGAGVGLLAGGVASLLGFGDNEEEVEQMMRDQEDVFAMQNRQSRATALDKDTKAEFYNRAADGKRPVWTPAGLIGKKATARVSNGEVVGNFEEGIATRIPGQKNNKDTKLAALKDGDFVISNKFGLSDYAAATGDYIGALNLQEMLMGMRNSKGYKNGKLPGFKKGWWEGVLTALPHLGGVLENIRQLNEDRNSKTWVPEMPIENPEAVKAYNQIMSDMISPTQYLNMSQRNYNHAAFNVKRDVGAGRGSRMIMLDALYKGKQAQDAETLMKIQEANRTQRNAGANLSAQTGTRNQVLGFDQFWKKFGTMQQQYAAQDYAKRTDAYNIYKMGAAGISALNDYLRYKQAYDIGKDQIGIWQQTADTDRMKVVADINRGYNPISTYVPSTSLYEMDDNTIHHNRGVQARNWFNYLQRTA